MQLVFIFIMAMACVTLSYAENKSQNNEKNTIASVEVLVDKFGKRTLIDLIREKTNIPYHYS